MEPWVKLLPQYPSQNFAICYGLVRIGGDFYTLSDLIEDNYKGAGRGTTRGVSAIIEGEPIPEESASSEES
jgi:hypothetical protein